MKLNRFEKIITTRNLREGMEKAALGLFDQKHLETLHKQMCHNMDHRNDLAPGKAVIPVVAMQAYSNAIYDTAKDVVGKKSSAEIASELAKAYVRTETTGPFASFNKHVGMLVVDGMAKSTGNAVDWKQVKGQDLDHAMTSLKAENEVSKLFEKAMMPKADMTLSPLERRETLYNRAKPSVSSSPRPTETYLIG